MSPHTFLVGNQREGKHGMRFWRRALLSRRLFFAPFFAGALLLASAASGFARVPARPDDDDDTPVQDRAADLPTGMRITPTVARGARFTTLNPDLPGLPNF